MASNFVNIGDQYGINMARVIAIVPARRAAGVRIRQQSDRQNKYIHACGAKTLKSLIVYDTGLVIGSYLNPRTLLKRVQGANTLKSIEASFNSSKYLDQTNDDREDSELSDYETDLLNANVAELDDDSDEIDDNYDDYGEEETDYGEEEIEDDEDYEDDEDNNVDDLEDEELVPED